MRDKWLVLLLAGWLALLPQAPALAQPMPGNYDSPRCQQQCGAILPRRQDNTREVQTCLLRCEALNRAAPPAAQGASPPAGQRTAPARGQRPGRRAELAPPGSLMHISRA